LLGVAGVCLALAACGGSTPENRTPATKPADDVGAAFVAIGDFGVGGEAERAAGEAIRRFTKSHPVDALVPLGDNDYTESESEFGSNWDEAFGWTKDAGLPVLGVVGNHEAKIGEGIYVYR
jgi:hypothetical protein